MADRCFWVSAAELVAHMLADGDCLQCHRRPRLFERRLQWVMCQCKCHIDGGTPEEPMGQTHLGVQAVPFQFGKGVGASQPVAAIKHQAEDSSGVAQPAGNEDDEASGGASQPAAAEENPAA